jgi:esterase
MLELNYKTFGQGDPIVILHGLFGMLDNWQTIGRQLAEDHAVYLIDQRNHGRSPFANEIDYPAMADDLKHFLESHWMFKANVIGHSMGGKTAMQFAIHHPEMVDKLVVIDIAPKPYQGRHQLIFDTLMDLDLFSLESRKEADEYLQERISDYSIRQFLLKNLSSVKNGRGYRWKMNLPVIYDHYEDILLAPELDAPFRGETLFIRGGWSNYIEEADYGLIKEWFPNSQIVTINDAGHWVHADAPEDLIQLLKDFLVA